MKMKSFCCIKDTIKRMKGKSWIEKYTYPKYTKKPQNPTIRKHSHYKSTEDLDRHMTYKHYEMLNTIGQ